MQSPYSKCTLGSSMVSQSLGSGSTPFETRLQSPPAFAKATAAKPLILRRLPAEAFAKEGYNQGEKLKTVYVLQSIPAPGEWYTGLAEDLGARLGSHNSGQSPHTAKFKPWRLVVSIRFEDDCKAVEFERYLKSGSGRAFALKHFRS